MLQLRKLNDNKMAIGKRIWAIADGYIPGWSKGMQPQLTSHEAICILNTDDEPALIEIIVYFSNRNPMGPFTLTVPPKRTKHLRLNDLTNPESIPHGVDYACTIESNVPIVVQHTRLDSRQSENALFSTIAFSTD
jgi:hypothetical protein